jgi:hypothetical protein
MMAAFLKVKLSLFYLVFFCLIVIFLPVSAASSVLPVSCPADGMVEISFNYSDTKDFLISTDKAAHYLPASVAHFHIMASSEGGVSFLAYNSNALVISNVICRPYVDDVWFSGLMGLGGILAAALLFYSIASVS